MGPLLRMQTRLHFEDLQENVQVQYLQKIALRAENKRVKVKGTQNARNAQKYNPVNLRNPQRFIASLEIFEEIFRGNNSVCLNKSKPERLTRPQAGLIIPVKTGPTNRSAEGTKDLSPFQGFRAFGCPIPGVLPPSVVSSPLRGFLFFNVNGRIMDR